ncbi:MAG: hypothetical protein ACM31L_16240 [Actinomycetota bacterium]
MRLLAMLLAAYWFAAGSSAKADWAPIPGNAGMAYFLGTWDPVCNGAIEQGHGLMTFHPDGRITYQNEDGYSANAYRVIEEAPEYVALLVRMPPFETRSERFQFVVLKLLHISHPPPPYELQYSKCGMYGEGQGGIRWDMSDDDLRRIWQQRNSCLAENITHETPLHFIGGRWGYCVYLPELR